MLAEAETAIQQAGFGNRIHLKQARLQELTLAHDDYSIIICNAMLHHLHDPQVLWSLIKTATGQPAVFVMDLMRPDSDEQVDALVETYAKDEPDILKRDFRNSLKAAFTPEEVRLQLQQAGLEGYKISVVSDRHLVVSN